MSLIGKIITANKPTDIFSGDNVNLIIEIENQEELFVKEIFLKFFGEINCQWDDLINKNREGEIVYVMQVFKDRQILVDRHINILTADTLNKGKHVYNIGLHIEQQLPESVTWKYGSVSYELGLGICSAEGVELLCKMPLKVKRYLNICLDKDYKQPFHTAFKKSLCWGVCLLQPIKIILTLPKTSFLPGDSLSYFIKIENCSKLLDIQQISILLTETQHYKALKPFKRIKQVHTTLKRVKQNFRETHHHSKLHGCLSLPSSLIPSSPPACFINSSYNLHFIFVVTGLQTDGIVSVPLKIGSHRNNLEKIADRPKCEMILEMTGDGEQRIEYEV